MESREWVFFQFIPGVDVIPAMTDPLGKYWDAPDRSKISFRSDLKEAYMSLATFNNLLDYSQSQPSGVYDGKMWRSEHPKEGWYLRWFAPCDKPKFCATKSVLIYII
jgi:hypothetical protein